MRKLILSCMFVFCTVSLFAQNITISGRVTDADDGSQLPGVTIVVSGTTNGTITDLSGSYSITAPSDAVLSVSFIGYATQTINVGGRTAIDVVLKAESTSLNEVVVVGYGVQKKSLVTGSIARVSGEDIAASPSLRVTQAIQGKTSGVVISNNSGQPGDAVSIRVRGTGTNGNAEPLYVVDGLPMDPGGIDFLTPNDIESIEVLKDASSAAIYGARGANGVVLITTKQGKKNDKFQVSYDGYYGVQNPWRKLSVLNTQEYVMIMNEMAANAGQSPKFPQAVIDTLTADTDWQDEMFNYNAPKQSHNLSFTGGSEKSTYSSSLSYFSQQGIVAKGQSQFDRFTYRLNTTREFGFFELGSNLNYANISSKGIATNDHFAGTSLVQALNTPPIVPVRYTNGEFATPEDYGVAMQEITNPIAILSYLNSATRTNKVVGGLSGNFNFGKLSSVLEGLVFRSSVGAELAYVQNRSYTPEYNLDATHISLVNRVGSGITQYNHWNVDNTLTYTTAFGKSNLSALVGHTAYRNWGQGFYGTKNDVIFDDFDNAYLDNAQDLTSAQASGGYWENRLLSYFGRVNYDFANRYMLTAILRADGSSRFGVNNRFGYFPSVSAGWVLSEESFMKGLSLINFLKLRASWGQNGNESIGDFAYTSVMSNQSIYYFGTNPVQYNGVQPSKIANPELRWEASEQTDIGFDLGLASDRVRLGVDYYIKTTKDWLLDAPAPRMLGNVPPTVNAGLVKNSGLETELTLKNKFNKVNVEVSLTGAFNKNEVVTIENQEKRIISGATGGFGQAGIIRAVEGQPMGAFYGYQVEGIFQNQAEIDAYVNSKGEKVQPNAVPGDIKFKDQNGDGKLNDNEDMIMIGDPNPDFTGGVNLSVSAYGVDFGMFWYAAMGHQVWNATRRYDMNYTNFTSDYLNRWTGEGTSTEYPRLTFSDLNQNWKTPSDFFVKDADFVRLRNLTLGYTLPKSVTEGFKVSKLRFYISGENVLTFTKYDGYEPEIGGSALNNGVDHGIYPQARTVLGGINFSF